MPRYEFEKARVAIENTLAPEVAREIVEWMEAIEAEIERLGERRND